jgi:5-methylcytosine-specific restriction endonuclease McrA
MKKKKVEKEPKPTPYNGNTWTEGRYRSFITSTIRGGFRRWPPKFAVLKSAITGKKINPKSGRLATMYECAECKEEFPALSVQVDHKDPVVGTEGFISWDNFIYSLFCEEDNLQVLCKECHAIKTKQETTERKKVKDEI